jgi:hypothetical protein
MDLREIGVYSDYWLDDRRIGISGGSEILYFNTTSRPALGTTQPPIQGVQAHFPRVKEAGV